MNRHAKVLVLGAGSAGYTAAIYAARAGLAPLVLTGVQPGGQLTITTEVENFPGFAAPVQGPWLMEQMQAQAEHVGAEIVMDTVASADLGSTPFRLTGEEGTYTCDTLIVATGAKARWLGVPGEAELAGRGVSACATCDGFFFRGKAVAVIGGGNSAVEEALYLSNLAATVTLIHRRDALRSERIMQARLFDRPNVSVIWDTVVEAMLDNSAVLPELTALALRNLKTGEASTLAVDGAFVAIGHDPASGLFKGQLECDEAGYIVTAPGGTQTSVPGVFAAGDVQDTIYRQAVTAAGTGCMAALDAERWLQLHPARLDAIAA